MEGDGAGRFEAFVDALAEVFGHADRVRPLRDYCMGLLTPAERKSVEPLAAVTAPSRVSAQHQSLLHFVAQSPWSDARVLAKVLELTLPSIIAREPIEAWIIDDTSFPKKGKHSVGVTRQYSGQLGKQDNCQVAVSLSLANAGASFPIAYRLYLPKDWAADPARRKKAGVPEEVTFRTKPEIALDQIRAALEAGAPPGVVLMDAGYGAETSLRSALAGLGLAYVAGVQPDARQPVPGGQALVRAWAPDEPHGPRPRPPAPVRRGSRAFASGRGLGDDLLARGKCRRPDLSLRACPCSRRAPGLRSKRSPG